MAVGVYLRVSTEEQRERQSIVTQRDFAIEAFLRNPGYILERLRERLLLQQGERQHQQKQFDALRGRLEEKSTERERMLGLYRRGRIDEATLDHHPVPGLQPVATRHHMG
jgi:hypothetical protein